MNILITAPFTRTDKGSEDALAWGIIKVLAAEHDVFLITSSLSQETLDATLEKNQHLRIKPFYIPWRRFEVPRFIRQFEFDFVNRKWNKSAFDLAKTINKNYQIHVNHRLGLQGFREPGYLWKNDSNFIIGPLAGLGMVPWQLFQFLPFTSKIRFCLRNIGIEYAFKYNRRINNAINKASAVIAPTRSSVKKIKEVWGKDSFYLKCLSVPPMGTEVYSDSRCSGDRLKIVWAGDLNPGKGLNILILALSKLKNIDFSLEIVGDGVMFDDWEDLVHRESLTKKVKFLGRKTREETIQIIAKSHVFVWVSVIDSMPNVMLEAMSVGVPIICLDHPEYIDFLELGGGLAVDISNRKSIILGLAGEISKLYYDEPMRLKMATLSKKTSSMFLDSVRSENLLKIYYNACNSHLED